MARFLYYLKAKNTLKVRNARFFSNRAKKHASELAEPHLLYQQSLSPKLSSKRHTPFSKSDFQFSWISWISWLCFVDFVDFVTLLRGFRRFRFFFYVLFRVDFRVWFLFSRCFLLCRNVLRGMYWSSLFSYFVYGVWMFVWYSSWKNWCTFI